MGGGGRAPLNLNLSDQLHNFQPPAPTGQQDLWTLDATEEGRYPTTKRILFSGHRETHNLANVSTEIFQL